jgi:hypothetical protein
VSEAANGSPDETRALHHEEVLRLGDDGGAGGLVGWVRVAVALLAVGSLVAAALVVTAAVRGVAAEVGGTGPLREFAVRLVADRPAVAVGVALAGLLFLIAGAALVRSFAANVGRALETEVRVRVSDDGVRVRRTGGQRWQSSGVDVPFADVVAVEYVDPEESSFRVELGDMRGPKFFAGRSRRWVRLERAGGPAVYIGSDRPRDLAAAVAEQVPGDVTARPF